MNVNNYRADIDGIRAVAVLMVVVYHAFPSALPAGFIGVDVFFVISGYLITAIIFKGLNDSSFNFLTFYSRRIKRLAPSLLVVLVATFVMGWFVLLPDEYRQMGKYGIASVFFIVNFLFSRELDYFDRSAEENPFLHLWSLSVEEQYYVVWPMLAFLAFRLGIKARSVILLITVISLALTAYFSYSKPDLTFFSPVFRAWEFGLGGLLVLSRNGKYSFMPNAQAVAGVLIIGLALLVISEDINRLSLWMALPVLDTCLLINAGPSAWINRKLLANKAVVFVGLISYPLYLWHWPLFAFMNITEAGLHGFAFRAGAVMLSFVLAAATWKLVEQPLRYSHSPRAVTALLASFIVLGVVSLGVYRGEGVPGRLSYDVVQANDQLLWPMDLRSSPECVAKYPGMRLSFCLESGPATATKVAIIGDSYSNQYYYGLSPAFAARGEQLINLGHHSCAPVWGVGEYRPEKDCTSIDLILERVIADPSITTVVLASAWSGTEAYVGEAQVKRFSRSLSDTIADLKRAGKKIFIIDSVPPHLSRPAVCVRRPVRLADHSGACEISRAVIEQRLLREREMISTVLQDFSDINRISPVDVLCDRSTCPLTKAGSLLYRDGHLSKFGSDFLARAIINRF